MTNAFTYRVASAAEVPGASAFVRAVYAAQIAPAENAEGRATFDAYTDPSAMLSRRATHVLWVATVTEGIVGVLEIRDATHVALLFVAPHVQRQGVGRGLLHAAFGPSERWPDLTVNSTSGAVAAYMRLGFQPDGPEEERNGLRYQPMRRRATAASDRRRHAT